MPAPLPCPDLDSILTIEGELSDGGIDAIARLLLEGEQAESQEFESSIGRTGGLKAEPAGGRKAVGGTF